MQPDAMVTSKNGVAGEHGVKKFITYTFQALIYPLLLVLRFLVVRDQLTTHPELIKTIRNGDAVYVVYANHQSKLDPLIICASFPIRALITLLPFRFFIENTYFKGAMKGFLNCMGGFPAHSHPTRPYGLEMAKSLLQNGQTIVIFPPGMRTREKTAKPGISTLSLQPGVSLIPVRINWKSRFSCEVNIGKIFAIKTHASAEDLMQKVYNIYE
jgi:1-acyl-sn-glycerol-3-phosphate acyltransferase